MSFAVGAACIGLIAYGVTKCLHANTLFEKMFAKKAVEKCFHATSSLKMEKILQTKAVCAMEIEEPTNPTNADEICRRLTTDGNIRNPGNVARLVQLVKGTFVGGNEFFLQIMDAVVITKLGIVILELRFPKTKYGKSVHIDLDEFSGIAWQNDLTLTCTLTGLGLVACGFFSRSN